MEYKIQYKIQNKMNAPSLDRVSLDGEIGKRFDRFVYERVSCGFAINEILREAEQCFADKYDDEYGAGMWRSEFWGKLIISAARVAKMKNDPALKLEISKSVSRMLGYQSDDGYLSAYRDRKNIFGSNMDDPTWMLAGWDTNWNIWGQKYTLWALIECAMLLNDERILSAAIKLADNVIFTLSEHGIRATGAGVQFGMAAGSIMKPMLILYRLTGDERYLAISKEIAEDFDREDGKCPNLIANSIKGIPAHLWYDKKDGWAAKAYEMMSCFDGICELYRITGDSRLLLATECFWELILEYESNILGSVGYCERFANAAAYPDSATEVCDAIHWMRLSYELFIITGKARYAGAFERAFLNAFLAGVYENGKDGAFFVRSSGRHWLSGVQCDTKYQHCCVNNVPRGFANAAELAVTESDGDYYVNCYYPTTVRLDGASFRIASGYTDNGLVPITVRGLNPGTKVYLRAPEWSKVTTATVMRSGESVSIAPGSYAAVTVDAEQTVIKVEFDMTARVIAFGGEFRDLPDTDYHVQRWVDPRDGVCDRGAMVKAPMCTVQRGPVVLARSKKIGSCEADMFSGKTVYGKDVECSAQVIRGNNLMVHCRVTLAGEGIAESYLVCDFASAANLDTFDGRYFTVFI